MLTSRRAILLTLVLCLLAPACRRERKVRVQRIEEDSAVLASVVRMNDAKAAPQLIKGFYTIESGAWRWTAGSFALALRPPRSAASTGATLHFRFTLPDAILTKAKPITLSASIGGVALPPETYTKAGAYDYARDVPPKLLEGEAVNVEFALDKFVPSGVIEDRELGVIATSASLEPKPAK